MAIFISNETETSEHIYYQGYDRVVIVIKVIKWSINTEHKFLNICVPVTSIQITKQQLIEFKREMDNVRNQQVENQ